MTGTDGDDLLSVTPDDAWLYGGDGNDTLLGASSDDHLDGGAGNDSMQGGDGDDWFDAEKGDDLLKGGAGFDTASYTYATAGVTVSLALTGPQAVGGGAGTDTLMGIEEILGSSYADVLRGNDDDNELWGYDEDDTLEGGAGSDTLFGVDGQDSLYGGSGDDVLMGDWNTHEQDLLDGGEGNDLATFERTTPRVEVDLRITTWQDTSGAGLDRLVSIEHLTGGYGSDLLIGDAHDNRLDGGGVEGSWSGDDELIGGAGNDTLLGSNGADTLQGGDGDDELTGTATPDRDVISVASYADAGAGVVVSLALATAQVTGGAGRDTLSLIRGLVGSDHADRLTGAGSDDEIQGGAGNDTLDGGAGQDTASYDLAPSAVVVSLALSGAQSTGSVGTDRLIGFERLTGSRFDDVLSGNDAKNTIEGGLGDDTLQGGGGTDLASYASAASGVSVDLSASGLLDSGAAGTDVFVAIEGLLGSGHADQMSGDDADNRLLGAEGDDRLLGGGGNDTIKGGRGIDVIDGGGGDDLIFGGTDDGKEDLRGGAGVDTLSFVSKPYVVRVRLDQADGSSGDDTYVGFENLVGSSARDTLGGDAGANRLEGRAGADTLIGDAGNDTLVGGDGADWADYSKISAGITLDLSLDTAQATGGAGSDTLLSIRHLRGSGSADVLSGNSKDNIIVGRAGADRLHGGDGDDSLQGEAGIDTLVGGAGNDTLNAGNDEGGRDHLKGGDGIDWVSFEDWTNFGGSLSGVVVGLDNDIGPSDNYVLEGIENLQGSYGSDHLKGDAGPNEIWGDYGGADTLTGGLGADDFWLTLFLFDSKSITDFKSGIDHVKLIDVVNYGDSAYREEIVAGPGGFSPQANVVVVTANIDGQITEASTAARIGNATGPIAQYRDMVFVVDNGQDSAVFAFWSRDGDARVEADELTLLALLQDTPSTTLADYVLG